MKYLRYGLIYLVTNMFYSLHIDANFQENNIVQKY